ncbi:MAG: flavin reductase family protein [Paracoccaceae bacterium]
MTMQSPNLPVSFAPDPANERLLRNAFGRFATGVTIVTAPSSDGPVGIVANSFSSVSLDPALVLWSVAKTSRRFPYFEVADHYAIHVLGVEQSALCDGVAKDAYALRDRQLRANADGTPLIEDCLARFECRRMAVHDAGDHAIILGQVQQTEMRDGDPLTFYAGRFGQVAEI